MAKKARHSLIGKSKLGEFYSPAVVANFIVRESFAALRIEKPLSYLKILEPSVGEGSFIEPIVSELTKLYVKKGFSIKDAEKSIYENNLFACDISEKSVSDLKKRFPNIKNVIVANYLDQNEFDGIEFDMVLGNPPFGVSIMPGIETNAKRNLNDIDAKYSERFGVRIKRESYSYFIVKAIESLANGGVLGFVTSDTFLTIKTFFGLRKFLFLTGNLMKLIESPKDLFAPETLYPTVSFIYEKGESQKDILFAKRKNTSKSFYDEVKYETVSFEQVKKTELMPISTELSRYFDLMSKGRLSSFFKCVGGLTTGNNEKFVFRIGDVNPSEIGRGKKYVPYNKSLPGVRWFSEPKFVIKWKNEGEELRKYKKASGKWYLGGMGGEKHYFTEGLSFNLVGGRINARWTPAEYVFDAGSPLIVFNEGVTYEKKLELLGYLNSNKATEILKGVINATNNIQPKDIERLPYIELDDAERKTVVRCVNEILANLSDEKAVFERENTINMVYSRKH